MKVLIADDHPLVRDALGRAMRQIEPDAELHEAEDYDSLRRLAGDVQPDLMLVDLDMPGMDALAGLRRLRLLFPTLAVVVASAERDPATIRAALATGASGFIPKTEPAEVLPQALRLVLAGGVYVPLDALAGMPGELPPAEPDPAALTPRQLDVLRALLRGQPNKLIARELCLTEGTVKIHIAALLRVLRASNRTEAVVRARELGLDDEA